jgi:hypothetical protein
MKSPLGLLAALVLVSAISAAQAVAQNLPGSLSFTVSGSFENAASESSKSLLISDNNLTDGYVAGMDQHDAPASLNPYGSQGSAAFQWGVAATNSSYAHSSALWFEPISGINIAPNQYFNLGYLYYRNGTIKSNTGATAVDLNLNLSFSNPSDMPAVNATFTSDLINSTNGNDPVASADIVSLRDWAAPLNYTDSSGNQYFLELTFKVDQNTLDGTLSTQEQFRVFEGGQGRAELLGRFTTTPGPLAIPEPSSAMLGLLGAIALLRRKR